MAIWGKLIGGVAGLAIGGPIGAVLGAVAGHAYDTWREESRQALPRGSEEPPLFEDPMETRRVAFATAVIVLAAKLAKVDGVVTRDEIRAFKRIFRIDDEEVGDVAKIYNEAKRSPHGFEPFARQIRTLFHHDKAMLEELLDGLFQVASADGAINPAELDYLARVAAILGFTPGQFQAILARHGAWRRLDTPPDPYSVLGLTRRASDEQVKSTYRKLVREHHPDRLIAKGLPKEFIDQANRKLAAINAAFDQIAKERGLR